MRGSDEWPLVGREAELDAARRALARRSTRAVVITGPPGIGKTRVLDAVGAAATGAGWHAISVRANRSAATVPFAATAHLVAGLNARDGQHELFIAAGEQLAGHGRVLLTVDDADRLDDASAALVAWLADQRAVVVALTMRTGEEPPDAVEQLVHGRGVTAITLDPLDRSHSHDLVVSVLGGPVDGVTFARLWDACGGNPLYLSQLLASGQAVGSLAEHDGVWRWRRTARHPVRLGDLVATRLAGLPDDDRLVLELVAHAEPVPADMLDTLAEPDAIARLESADLLRVVDEGGPPVVRLVHPLFTEALLHETPPLRARQVQQRLVDAHRQRSEVTPADAFRVAHGALATGISLDAATLCQAARHAIELLELELAEQLAAAAQNAGGGWEAAQARAEALRRQHRSGEADDVLAAAAELPATDRQRARLAVTRAENLYWGTSRADDAAGVLAQARREVGRDADGALLAMQAMLWLFEGRAAEAYELSGKLAASSPDDEVGLWALSTAAFSATAVGRPSEAVELAAAGCRHPAVSAGVWKEAQFRWALAEATAALGDLETAADEADDGYQGAVAADASVQAGGWAVVQGLIVRQRGRLASAADRFREAVALLGDLDPYRLVSLALAELGVTLGMRHDHAGAEAALTDADARRQGSNQGIDVIVEVGHGWVQAARGDLEQGAARAVEAAERANSRGQRQAALHAAHAGVLMGRPALAIGLLDRLAVDMEGPWPSLLARHARAAAADDHRELSAVGTDAAALGAYGIGVEAFRRAAAVLQRAGRSGAARLAAGRSRELAAFCEWPAAAPAESRSLTARELQVVRLAAAGSSSREVADTLGLSVRTVDNHLSHAYQKLGVAGRHGLTSLTGLP